MGRGRFGGPKRVEHSVRERPGSTHAEKKIVIAIEKWTHAKNNKKNDKKNTTFSEKRKKQRTLIKPRIECARWGGLGGRPERKQKLVAMEKWTQAKNQKKNEKTKKFSKP